MFKKSTFTILIITATALMSVQNFAYGIESKASTKPSSLNSATDPRITKLTAELEYASKSEAVEIKKYITAKEERLAADAKLSSLNSKINSAQAAKDAAEKEEASAKAEFAESQRKYDESIKESKEAKTDRDKAVVDLYIQGSDPDFIPSVLDVPVEERQNVIRKTIMHFRYTQEKIDKIVISKEKAEEAEIEKAEHIVALKRADDAKAEAQKQEDALAPLKSELVVAQNDAKSKENLLQRALDGIKSQKSSYTKQIDQITAESNALAAEIRRRQSQAPAPAPTPNNPSPTSPAPSPANPGRMIHPVPGAINSSFGYRTHPIYGDARLHAGIDFNASIGTPIKAAKAGRVIYAAVMSGYGNVIVVDHGGGISTLYAHQSSFAVGNGANVSQGQVIGYVGMSGNVTGPHLHFEVRVNGTPTNPMAYL